MKEGARVTCEAVRKSRMETAMPLTISLRQTLTHTPPAVALEMLGALRVEIEGGWLIPYLGPGVLEAGPATTAPLTTEALAMGLQARAPVGAAKRGNCR
jgi:hypothetical protein